MLMITESDYCEYTELYYIAAVKINNCCHVIQLTYTVVKGIIEAIIITWTMHNAYLEYNNWMLFLPILQSAKP